MPIVPFSSVSSSIWLHWIIQPHVAMQFQMAFPDGFLNLTVIFVTSVLGISLIVLALNQVQAEYQEKAIVTICNNLHKRET